MNKDERKSLNKKLKFIYIESVYNIWRDTTMEEKLDLEKEATKTRVRKDVNT